MCFIIPNCHNYFMHYLDSAFLLLGGWGVGGGKFSELLLRLRGVPISISSERLKQITGVFTHLTHLHAHQLTDCTLLNGVPVPIEIRAWHNVNWWRALIAFTMKPKALKTQGPFGSQVHNKTFWCPSFHASKILDGAGYWFMRSYVYQRRKIVYTSY
jgi:hypothetical protein